MKWLLTLVFVLIPAHAADITSLYTHMAGGGFRLPLKEPQVSWRQLAMGALGKDVAKPEATRALDYFQNKDGAGVTEVNFPVSQVPTTLKDRRYYAVSIWGLTPLRLRMLMGAVRYGFDPKGLTSTIQRVGYSGDAIFDPVPEDGWVEAAFVVSSDAELKIEESLDIPADALVIKRVAKRTRITHKADGKSRSILLPEVAPIKPEATALVSIEGEKYIFIQWPANKCAYNFHLLKLGPTALTVAGKTSYGCENERPPRGPTGR
jgi:hypothetical protein